MTCRIDHSDPTAIPAIMCRCCHPVLAAPMGEPYAPAGAPEVQPMMERYSTTEIRLANLTPADIKAIAEITDTRARAKTDKANGRVARMLVKKESKAIPKGARWDSRCCKWITQEEISTPARK